RNPERMRNLGYDDADTTLRIARGRVIERPNDYNFVVDADGLSGNSGGPVVNERGELVGIVHDVYPREEGRRRPCQFGGGLICVSAHSALAWLT
ncbi:MAG: S46 family peptidase, partial [Bacillota bacterium]